MSSGWRRGGKDGEVVVLVMGEVALVMAGVVEVNAFRLPQVLHYQYHHLHHLHHHHHHHH